MFHLKSILNKLAVTNDFTINTNGLMEQDLRNFKFKNYYTLNKYKDHMQF